MSQIYFYTIKTRFMFVYLFTKGLYVKDGDKKRTYNLDRD